MLSIFIQDYGIIVELLNTVLYIAWTLSWKAVALLQKQNQKLPYK